MRAIADKRISQLGPGALVALALIVLFGLALIPLLTSGGCSKPAGAAVSRALPRLSPGDRRTYDVRASSAAELGGSPLTEFEVSGKLVVTTLDSSADGVRLLASMEGARLHTKYASLQPEFAKLERDLETPFVFALEPGGTAGSFAFRDQPSTLVLGIRRWLGAALQAPARGPGDAWLAQEADATGRYTISYGVTGRAGVLRRQKVAYLAPAAGTRPSIVIDTSEGTVQLADTGEVDSIEADEALHTTASQMLPVRSTSHITLRTLAREHIGPPDLLAARGQADGARPFDPSAASGAPPRESPAVDDARIAGRSLPEVLAALREIRRAPRPADETARKVIDRRRVDLFAALTALVRRRPAVVPDLAGRIDRGDELAATMIDALGAAGTTDAHHALTRTLAARQLDPVLLKVAALALSRTQHPTAESIEGLRSALDLPGLRTQAMYGLGTTVRRLRESGDEPRAEQVLQLLLDRLQGTQDPLVIVTTLRAIANSGHEKAFAAVERQLASADGEVRAAAAEALQLMPDARVDGKLAGRIAGDQVIEVRAAALRAARLRTPSTLLEESVIRCARADDTPAVRLGAVRAIERWLVVRPSLRPVLEDIAAHETHESVRAEALSALAIHSGGGGDPQSAGG